MDVLSLNLFQKCLFLKHLGKVLMVGLVLMLVAGTNYAVWSNVLIPGILHGGTRASSEKSIADTDAVHANGVIAVQALYALLGALHAAAVGMLLWCYYRTVEDSPGLVPEKWYPFKEYIVDMEHDVFRSMVIKEYGQVIAAKREAGDPHCLLEAAYMHESRPRWCKKCQVRAVTKFEGNLVAIIVPFVFTFVDYFIFAEVEAS